MLGKVCRYMGVIIFKPWGKAELVGLLGYEYSIINNNTVLQLYSMTSPAFLTGVLVEMKNIGFCLFHFVGFLNLSIQAYQRNNFLKRFYSFSRKWSQILMLQNHWYCISKIYLPNNWILSYLRVNMIRELDTW